MLVTCRSTGDKIDKKTAFSIVLSGNEKKSYFTSEEIYNTWIAEKNAIEEGIPSHINYILGRAYHTSLSRQIKAKINKWRDSYSYVEIERCLFLCRDKVFTYRSKGVAYVLQVIENMLIQYQESYKSKIKSEKKIESIELDNVTDIHINNYKCKSKGWDIRKWI